MHAHRHVHTHTHTPNIVYDINALCSVHVFSLVLKVRNLVRRVP